VRLIVVLVAAAIGITQAGIASPVPNTPLPPIAARKTQCPKVLYKTSRIYGLQVVVAAEKGQHPSPSLLTCQSAYTIALAGKKDFQKPPFRTGQKIEVSGATYTLGVGGPDIWPPASGPVYGWFGNGIEVLLMIPSGP